MCLIPTKLGQYSRHFVQKPFLLTALASIQIEFTNRGAANFKKVVLLYHFTYFMLLELRLSGEF